MGGGAGGRGREEKRRGRERNEEQAKKNPYEEFTRLAETRLAQNKFNHINIC